jgi:hypothetical protein
VFAQVSKGFSFVLVCIVMVVMLVFGLISDSVSGADLRLSQKSVQTQQIYYDMDSTGERLLFSCATAVSAANNSAKLFISEQKYNSALPKDFYSFLVPLAEQYKKDDSSATESLLQKGVFFYYLDSQLALLKSSDGITYKMDQAALQAFLSGNDKGNAVIVTVQKTISSSIDSKYVLNISLSCTYPVNDRAPTFTVVKWSDFVNGASINDNQKVNVWDGK